MKLLNKMKDLFSIPKLHARIDELEAELKARPVINHDKFYDVAKPIDISGVKGEIADRIIEEFKPFMERHAIECLKQAFKDKPNMRPMRMEAAYDVINQAVVVNAIMPQIEARFQVHSPRF